MPYKTLLFFMVFKIYVKLFLLKFHKPTKIYFNSLNSTLQINKIFEKSYLKKE